MTERDTVVSAHVKVGPGSSRVKVLKQYHVLDIHDKYTEMLTWMTARTISRLLRDNEVKDVAGTRLHSREKGLRPCIG